MKRVVVLVAWVAVLSVLLPPGVGLSQAPPGLTVVYRTQFEAVTPATPFDVLMRVVEFEPGGWQPPHLHPGGAFVTVLEGTWTTIRIVDGGRDGPATYGPGDTALEPAWSPHEAGNTGSGRTSLLVTRLQPRNVPETIFLPVESSRPGAPRPQISYQAEMEVTNLSGPIDLYHQVLEVAPGARLPSHLHPGPELGISIEGEATLLRATEETVGAGGSWVFASGEIHGGSNATSETARVATTHLIPAGVRMSFAAE